MKFEKDASISGNLTVFDQRSKEAKFFHVLHDVYDIIERESIDVWLDAGALLKHTRGQNIYPS